MCDFFSVGVSLCGFGVPFGGLWDHFGHHLGAFGLSGAPLGAAWRPKGHQKSEKGAKKGGLKSTWAPRGTKREPKAPQDLQNGAPRLQKVSQNHEKERFKEQRIDRNR